MKRLLFLLLALIPLAAHAQFTTASDGNGGLVVTGFSPNTVTSLTIPATINSQPVTGIGAQAFLNFQHVTSVTIPNSVTNIGSQAFENCVLMTNVSIGSGVTSIADNVFNNCASLSSVTLPNSVTTLGAFAFFGCANLTTINLGTGVTAIGAQTFAGCVDLNAITIPTSVTSIGDQAFMNCVSMASVSIGSSVTSIGYESFFGCDALITVAIPSSVTFINVGAFDFCTSLTTISVSSLNSTYSGGSDGVLFDKAKATLLQFPGGKTGSYVIPASVNSITNEAFYGAENLTSVTIPSGVTTIGDYTFLACTGLTSATIPASVTTLGTKAFGSCTALTGVTLPASLTTIGDDAFSFCSSLATITIPNSVTTIESGAFESCTSLQSVTIGNGVTVIGQFVFYNCTSLTSALFTGNAPSIGEALFLSDSNILVSYYKAATGFTSPTWTDSAGDTYPTTALLTPQTITFPAIGTVAYPSSPLTLTASASSGLTVTFQYVSGPASLSGTTLTLNGTGVVTVKAMQTGNGTYAAAPTVTQSFSVETSENLSDWETSNSITDLSATPFGDGVQNLFKYLFHIDPTTSMVAADRNALPKVGTDTATTAGTTYLTLTYREYALASQAHLNVQSSTDMQTWTTVTPDFTFQTGTDPNTNDPIITVEVKVTGARQFIRLNATAP